MCIECVARDGATIPAPVCACMSAWHETAPPPQSAPPASAVCVYGQRRPCVTCNPGE